MPAWRVHLSDWARLHPDFVIPLVVVLVMRIWFGLTGALVIVTYGMPIVPSLGDFYSEITRVLDAGFMLFLTPWHRWDAVWYMKIAEFGYSPTDHSLAFFPLFPILTRLVAFITSNYLFAGLIISTLSTYFAFVLLYCLGCELYDPTTARRSLIYLATFPTAFFLLGGYGEPLLLVTALAAMYFARQGRGLYAALASAGAVLSRPYGLLIVLPLAIEALLSRGRRIASFAAIGAAVGAMTLWLLYQQLSFGDALLWMHGTADNWQDTYVIPGQTILLTIQFLSTGQGAVWNNLIDLTLTLIVLFGGIVGLKKMPASYSAYALIMLITPLALYSQGMGSSVVPMLGMGRRVLNAFPAFIMIAATWQGRWKERIWIIISASFLTVLFVQFVWGLMVE